MNETKGEALGEDYTSYHRKSYQNWIILIWTSYSFIMGIAGNGIVFLAVLRRGINLDKLSLILIRNLAISDILFTLIWILPTLITLLAGGRWVLGEWLCHATTYLQYTTAITTICFITILSSNKYVRCAWPLRSWKATTQTAWTITVVSWFLAFIHPGTYFVSNLIRTEDPRQIRLYPPKSSCDYQHLLNLSDFWRRVDMAMAIVYTFTPCAVMLTVNGGLLKLVQGKHRYNKSNLVLTMILTAVFLVSYLPWAIKYTVTMIGAEGIINNQFRTLMMFMLYTNSWFNIFAYYCTNETFRRFMACLVTRTTFIPRRPSIVTSVIIENSTLEILKMRSASLGNVFTVRRGSNASSGGMLTPGAGPRGRRSVSVVTGTPSPVQCERTLRFGGLEDIRDEEC